jgi:hypothetical protein
MKILALDPGTTQTGWVIIDEKMRISQFGIHNNRQVLKMIKDKDAELDLLATEMIGSYGMAVGKEVFETCVWIGRFIQYWKEPDKVIIVYRKDVKMHLCHSMRAKDANIRQAIIDLYEPLGGGSTPQIGTKDRPGPLYGVSSHVWPAIGVAIVALHQSKKLDLPDTLPLYQTNGITIEEPPPF